MPLDVLSQAMVLRWAWGLQAQVRQLREMRVRVLTAALRSGDGRSHTQADNLPFYDLYCATHFTVIAAAQLRTALQEFDGDQRLPTGLSSRKIRILRDALEHWEDDSQYWGKEVARRGVDPTRHVWSHDGSGTIGELVDDEDLLIWANKVYADVQAIDRLP